MQIIRRVFLALFVAVIIVFSWLKPLDSTAIEQIDTGLNRALISFASARVLNAAISVAQGTEVAIQPAGVGVNFTPGQALDPINDLVEQFSTLMLVACVAFGVQKILISIGGYWLISLVLTTASLVWVWFYFRQQNPPAWLAKILVMLLMIRFAIPMVTIGTDLMFQKFMASDYQASQMVIDAAPDQVADAAPVNVDSTAPVQATELNPPEPTLSEDQGYLKNMKEKMKGKLKELFSNTKAAVDFKAHYMELKQKAEQWAEHIIKLIVIFLLQTLVIPLLLIWALYAVARGTFELPAKMINPTEN